MKKRFSEHYENILKEENIEKNDNLASENVIVSNILTKISKRIRDAIHSEEASKKVNKARKFLKTIDSCFHSIFDSKWND